MQNAEKETLVEYVFRHEYGKIISLLTHKFGPIHLERIEDAVQDALIKAMQVWGYNGAPQNPTAWLLRVANNQLIDRLRKDKKVVDTDFEQLLNKTVSIPKEIELEEIINDSQLKMIFACCHPSLSPEYQIILSLKLIAGFGNAEIAKAMLKKEETVAKSFTRAKKRLKENVKTLDTPIELGLKSRLNIVLKVIYLLFSEGYAASSGTTMIKKDFCIEAIRLAQLLTRNKYCKLPEVHALMALMCFHTARFDARIDAQGEMVDLENQDRRLYNAEMINNGIRQMERASVASTFSDYHLQATVSYYHCIAKKFSDTDWKGILALYDLQLQRQYSPIVQLNRIVPFHKVHGAEKAMQELQIFEQSPHFIDNTLFYAIKSELLSDLEDWGKAIITLKRAIESTGNELERQHLKKKLTLLESRE
ncbi:RNA polymerase sigma factor [Maribacter algicola]|uniref:RNA polymerase sigma factor n=1 Tax=Meishania litoralis TaxID=3434685 RepID=A0ACC7LI62_9FLAO